MTKENKLFSIFLAKAKRRFGDKFDYSNADYKDSITKIKIFCPKHGEFLQEPVTHVRAAEGCPKCGFESSAKASSDTQESFIKKAREKHNDVYLYDKVLYVDSLTPVTITCKQHGDFEQIPSSHVRGRGCPDCGFERASKVRTASTEEFLDKIKPIQGNKWDYSELDYKGCHTKVKLICPDHGEFYKTPSVLTSRVTGCPTCSSSKGELMIRDVLMKYGIPFKKEFNFSKYNNRYRFDFFLHTHRVLIEIHGQQHYKPVRYFDIRESLESRQRRDAVKIGIAFMEKIPLIEFNYTHLTLSLEEFEKLVMDSIRTAHTYRIPYMKIPSVGDDEESTV